MCKFFTAKKVRLLCHVAKLNVFRFFRSQSCVQSYQHYFAKFSHTKISNQRPKMRIKINFVQKRPLKFSFVEQPLDFHLEKDRKDERKSVRKTFETKTVPMNRVPNLEIQRAQNKYSVESSIPPCLSDYLLVRFRSSLLLSFVGFWKKSCSFS